MEVEGSVASVNNCQTNDIKLHCDLTQIYFLIGGIVELWSILGITDEGMRTFPPYWWEIVRDPPFLTCFTRKSKNYPTKPRWLTKIVVWRWLSAFKFRHITQPVGVHSCATSELWYIQLRQRPYRRHHVAFFPQFHYLPDGRKKICWLGTIHGFAKN